MAILGEITHTTTYRYVKPVTFGTHRGMFLPWRGASARLLAWSAKTSLPSKIHWINDSRSNTVTVMEFGEPGRELTISVANSTRRANHFDFTESCQAPKSKIFCFAEDPNQWPNSSRPVPTRGAVRGRHGT